MKRFMVLSLAHNIHFRAKHIKEVNNIAAFSNTGQRIPSTVSLHGSVPLLPRLEHMASFIAHYY